MKTIAVIAEFNPFHNGHLHLIKTCKEQLKADRCLVIMSGDFVQRGAPAIMDKFTRTQMALSAGADAVFELPIYYSTGSAEYFARGSVSILDKLGLVDYLCFGSECDDIAALTRCAEALNNESDEYKKALSDNLQSGMSYPSARAKALSQVTKMDETLLSEPNNILAIEYIRAISEFNSKIIPFTVKRIGEGYNSDKLAPYASATAIRESLLSEKDLSKICSSVPDFCHEILGSYDGSYATANAFSEFLKYRLILEKNRGFEKYLDVTADLSNRISDAVEKAGTFDDFCSLIKSKNVTYSRVSRCLLHILLNITADNMQEYKEEGYTSYGRILGMKESSSDLIRDIKKTSSIPVFINLKEANSSLSPLQKRLFDETLTASELYNETFKKRSINEFRLKPLIV